MDALDVERAQPFLDQLFELVGERRLLDLVFALEQIDRIDRAGGDLLADRGRCRYRHERTSG